MEKISGNVCAIINLVCFIFIYSIVATSIIMFFDISLISNIFLLIVLFFVFGYVQHKILVIPINLAIIFVEKHFMKNANAPSKNANQDNDGHMTD
jgi:hypothetical protein